MRSKQQQLDSSSSDEVQIGRGQNKGSGRGNAARIQDLAANSPVGEELNAHGMDVLLDVPQVESSIPFNASRYDAMELNHIQDVCAQGRIDPGTLQEVDEMFVQIVANYQKDNRLGVDGKVGKKTFRQISVMDPGSSDINDMTPIEIWFLQEGLSMLRKLLGNSKLHNVATIDIDGTQCLNVDIWEENKKVMKVQRKALRNDTRLTEDHISYIMDYQSIFGLPQTGVIDESLQTHIEIMYDELITKSGYTENEQRRDETLAPKEMDEEINTIRNYENDYLQFANTTWKHHIRRARRVFEKEGEAVGSTPKYDSVDFESMLTLQKKFLIPISGIPDDETMEFFNQILVADIADPSGNIKGDSANDNVKVDQYTKKRVVGSLFVNGISYSDVEQNALGDCWWLAALASVAKTDPDAIRNMFTDNKDGTFSVHLYSIGTSATKKTYRLDTDFWFNKFDTPAFAGYGDLQKDYRNAWGRELWVMLAEKALAMHTAHYRSSSWQTSNGTSGDSYANTEGGFGTVGLQIITGKESSFVGIDPKEAGEAERVWAELKEGIGNNEDIVASSGGKEPAPPQVPNMLMATTSGLPDITDHLDAWSSQWRYIGNVPAATQEYMRLIKAEKKKLRSSYLPDMFTSSYKADVQDFEKDFLFFMEARADNTVSGHAWTVIDVFEASDVRYVKIFNPWRSTQASSEGVNDGVFVLTLQEFIRRYQGFSRQPA
ncbi:MAG: C2 family cysteine protease [Myxococcota bacterium]|nr:C2 family cysteine protease [Myxococcota bacterium]